LGKVVLTLEVSKYKRKVTAPFPQLESVPNLFQRLPLEDEVTPPDTEFRAETEKLH
jgi:hypothetical protein